MKQGQHLPWLLAVVVALLLLRWLAPLHPGPSALEVVLPASPDTGRSSTAGQDRISYSGQAQPATALPTLPAEAAASASTMGNAFAARRPTAAVAASVHSSPIQAVQVTRQPVDTPPQPPAPPPPEPPPLQVIGTWDDGAAPGVFIATPQSTVLARKGSLLMSDYRVVEINTQAVSLLQLSNQTPWTLAVPQNAPPSQPAGKNRQQAPGREANLNRSVP